MDDASDEIDDDREERVDVSEIIDSGDDTDEEESVIDGRRANAEKGPWFADLQPQVSTVVLAKLAFCAWVIAMLIDERAGQSPLALTAGVLKVLTCGVNFGVGNGPIFGSVGTAWDMEFDARGVGSSTRGIT